MTVATFEDYEIMSWYFYENLVLTWGGDYILSLHGDFILWFLKMIDRSIDLQLNTKTNKTVNS